MTDSQVRVGFVGCGVHAREVLLPAGQYAGMEIAAVCDLDKRLAQRVARRFGAFRSYQDMRMMINEMDLDAVLICGPPEVHAEAAEIALEHGCHAFTEMPAAPTSEEITRIAEVAAARGLIAWPGLAVRCAPACVRLREIVTGEQFGPVRSVEVTWWPPKQHGHGDPLLFDLPHALDLVRFVGGEIRRLCVARAGSGGELSLAMELASGAVAAVSFAAPAGCPREMITVASFTAVATVENRQTVTLRHSGCEETRVWNTAAGTEPQRMRGFLPEMERFAAAVVGAEVEAASMADAARAVHLAELIATNTGEMIDVG